MASRPRWTTEELVVELDLLLGTDTPQNIATRLDYASVHSLSRVLFKRGLKEHANRLTKGMNQRS
jgi:Arc/MetJ family transcription regulator